jgi:transcriptional regulator with XRE-family HTH domain
MDLKEVRRKLMQDPEVAVAYQRLRPKLELGRQILDLRLERGWTQKELAERAGTKQANISRLENALLNPSMDMLQRVASALGGHLVVEIVPEAQSALNVPNCGSAGDPLLCLGEEPIVDTVEDASVHHDSYLHVS